MCGRFFESPSSFGLGPAKRGIPGAVSKEALLMRENKERHQAQERDRCQIGHVPGKPPSSSCAEPAKEMDRVLGRDALSHRAVVQRGQTAPEAGRSGAP